MNVVSEAYAVLTNIGYICFTGWTFTNKADSVQLYCNEETAQKARDGLYARYTNFGKNECSFDGKKISYMDVVKVRINLEIIGSESDVLVGAK